MQRGADCIDRSLCEVTESWLVILRPMPSLRPPHVSHLLSIDRENADRDCEPHHTLNSDRLVVRVDFLSVTVIRHTVKTNHLQDARCSQATHSRLYGTLLEDHF
jgi:hypothetical protein